MSLRSESGRPVVLDGQSGPARRIPATRAEEMVEAAMDARPAAGAPSRDVGDAAGFRARHERTLRAAVGWGAVLILVSVAGTAGAVFLVVRRWAPQVAQVRTDTLPAPAPPAKPRGLPGPTPNGGGDLPAEEARVIEEPSVKALPPPREETADELLRRASELRAKQRWMEATRAYENAARLFPNSAEAYSASVSAGLLHLDHLGDPRGALRLLASALRMRPEGALSEEARWGRIEAYRALGEVASERSALRDFVARYPTSLFSARADARLRDLAASP